MTRPLQPDSGQPSGHESHPDQHAPFQHTPFPRVPDHYFPDEYDPIMDAAPYNPVLHDPDYFVSSEDSKAASPARDADDAAIRPFDENPKEMEDGLSDLLNFPPVPGTLPDGWNPRRQQIFIRNLATGAGVSHAARTAGMTPRSAYLLRARKGAEGFIAAWDKAVQLGVAILEDAAFDLALNGAPVHKVNAEGQIIHTEYRINASVLMQLLRAHKPLVYSHAAQRNAVRIAEEERQRAERELANYKAAMARAAAPPDPQEEAVRMCLAEDEIIKAAAEAGIEPDLSDEYVAYVADRMERIAPDQVTVIGVQLLEKRYAAAAAKREAAAENEDRGNDRAKMGEIDDDNDDDDDAMSGPPLNRAQRRAHNSKHLKAQNRKMHFSYSNTKNRQKSMGFR